MTRRRPRRRRRSGSAAPTPRWTPSLQPDADHRLADGVVVEATLVARLFGAKVLRVDGTVLLAPGRLVEPEGAVPRPPQPVASAVDVGKDGLVHARRLLTENGRRLESLR